MFTNLPHGLKITLQLVFVLVALGAAFTILTAMGGFERDSNSHRLRFEVEASGGQAVITLDAGETKIPNAKQVSAPWSQTVKVESGTEVYLTAANPNAIGEVSCIITLDGSVWKMETTSAPNTGVACAGIVP